MEVEITNDDIIVDLADGRRLIVPLAWYSFVISLEAIFGAPDERLTIRHDAGAGAAPYIQGALLAIRKVRNHVGLIRGLDRVMD